jgi:hypothetical protein
MTKGPNSTFTRTLGVRIQHDEADYIEAKAHVEGRSIAEIIREYITWGIEAEQKGMQK